MDLDIEMGDVAEAMQDGPGHEIPQAEDILVRYSSENHRGSLATNSKFVQQPNEPDEPGEVVDDEPAGGFNGVENTDDDSKTIIPTKVHIRGLDTLHTEDIKTYVKAHYGSADRIEWIDDTSANLLFNSAPTAREAIAALSAIEVADTTALAIGEFLPAKPFEGRPEITLQVRFALGSDQKQAGAALRSRYYLLHPEHDPEERRRRQHDNISRYRDRDGDRRRNGGRRRRDSDDAVETFEASMYDDPPERERAFAEENRGKELFGERSARRDRSASPRRDGEGDARMDELDRSSRRNRDQARHIKGRLAADNSAKELFPTKASGKSGQLDQLERSIGSARLREEDMPKVVDVPEAQAKGAFNIKGLAGQQGPVETGFSIKGAATANARELFPGKLGSGNEGKELLDTTRPKRRQKAHDLFS